jgi:hypothetical protein
VGKLSKRLVTVMLGQNLVIALSFVLCVVLFIVAQNIRTEAVKYYFDIAFHLFSIITIVRVTVIVFDTFKNIPYSKFLALYIGSFIILIVCTINVHGSMSGFYWVTGVVSFLMIVQSCFGFRIVRASKSIGRKVLGYLVIFFLMAISAIIGLK